MIVRSILNHYICLRRSRRILISTGKTPWVLSLAHYLQRFARFRLRGSGLTMLFGLFMAGVGRLTLAFDCKGFTPGSTTSTTSNNRTVRPYMTRSPIVVLALAHLRRVRLSETAWLSRQHSQPTIAIDSDSSGQFSRADLRWAVSGTNASTRRYSHRCLRHASRSLNERRTIISKRSTHSRAISRPSNLL